MKVLLTGGAGYIGSHTAVEMIAAGHEVVIIDSLINSKASVIGRIEEIAGSSMSFHEFDIADASRLAAVCSAEGIEAIVHFAGLKAVGESVSDPLRYYQANLTSSMSLAGVMQALDIRHLVFSSSATVYGEPERIPLDENCRATEAANPYGRTKIMIEQMLRKELKIKHA